MPVLDEATFSGRRAGSLPIAVSTSGKSSLSIPNGVVKAAAPLVDLLDLSSDDAPAPTSFKTHDVTDAGRLGYKIDGKDVLEEGQINNFPREL
ncbi:unnamed protein product [Brassica oleracea var. botrytis]|uniref:(rape) hypothetical protein n=2 Tax=Brassica TaxID=3705 RepID=A0A816RQZ5_BRANA|nr:unnamed protein product [Brassica napus]